MKILCTFPGKYGDLLWALPTIRAISRRVGVPVDLAIAGAFGSIVPLLEHQPYLGKVFALDSWEVRDTAPISPREPPSERPEYSEMLALNFAAVGGPYNKVLHLGYRDWPLPDVARHTWETARMALAPDAMLEELDLTTPWITIREKLSYSWSWNYGFTDEYFELKYGVVNLLEKQRMRFQREGRLPPTLLGAGNPRWEGEAGYSPCTWEESAVMLRHTQVFLTDCSALHVLAVAVGCPVVMLEPQTMRHNQVFYPLGTQGPQVVLVRGSDGKPTFDARHVGDALELALAIRSIENGTERTQAGEDRPDSAG